VMSAIADRLGVAIHWKDTGGFDNIIPGLKSGRYDVALANIDANKKRFQQVDFVGYYVMSAIADRLGVAIHWKDTGGFDNIIPGLKSGR
ncbi:transporter substrate-binding domain-containing protein, partial [Enterobacter hormaechei]|uniref:transporter substrate-binding domain-containing protein n=1 Tax=Enterobacter hormaechei TaxID=158836 RepID=UPI001F0A8C34